MSETERIERLEAAVECIREEVQDCKLWEAAHDGVINEKWRNQEATNAMVVSSVERLSSTMQGISKRVNIGIGMFILGGAVFAFVGAYFGSAGG